VPRRPSRPGGRSRRPDARGHGGRQIYRRRRFAARHDRRMVRAAREVGGMEQRVKYWGAPEKQTLERSIVAGLAAYETVACLPGSPLPPLTRFISNHGWLQGLVIGVLVYHFYQHRKRL